mmetsp:Transcript_20040/g.42043  ORF Transcript_20040/g.42043 Transcript_20040/m.42043 type:complete len:370 (-) Transcript_20040:491-1600(-)
MILSSTIKVIQRSIATRTLLPSSILAQATVSPAARIKAAAPNARFSTAPLTENVNAGSDAVQDVAHSMEVAPASDAGDSSRSTASNTKSALKNEETSPLADSDTSAVSITSEFRTGVVRWIDHQKQTGVIIQDTHYSPEKPAKRFHFHFFDIVPREERQFMSKIGKGLIEPRLRRYERVKFRVYERPGPKRTDNENDHIESVNESEDKKGKSNEKLKLGVCDIRYGSGEHVPVMKFNDAMMVMRKEKAKLGHDVYNALASFDDPDEMASTIKTSFTNCSNLVNWAKHQIYNPNEARKLITAEFGTKVFEFMEEAEKGKIHDLKEQVNKEYSMCRIKLKEFDRIFDNIGEIDALNHSGSDNSNDDVRRDE